MQLQLLSRRGCHLCEEMQRLLEAELPRLGASFTIEDVDSKPEWRRRYGEVVPVLLRNGRAVAKIRLDRPRLERIVRRRRLSGRSS